MQRLTVSALALLIAAPALATGYVDPPAQPVVVPAEETWTGAYIGAQVDLFDRMDGTQFGGPLDGYDGTFAGGFAGYRYDFGDIVLGAEFDVVQGGLDRSFVAPGTVVIGPGDIDVTILRFGAEAGYDLGDILVYGTAGLAQMSITNAFGRFSGDGRFYGVGADYRLNQNLTVGAEVLQQDFDDFPAVPGLEYEVLTFGLNLAFTF